jgi:hypothetical protein
MFWISVSEKIWLINYGRNVNGSKEKMNFVISVSVLIILVLPKFENTSGFVCQEKIYNWNELSTLLRG